MNILFVGDLNDCSRTFQRYITLQNLGHSVVGLRTVRSDYRPGVSRPIPLFLRFCIKLGYPVDSMGVNKKLLSAVALERFDVVWIEKGITIHPSTLKKIRCKQPGIKIASYTEDDMFVRHNHSFWYLGCLPLYDIIFTTKSYNCNPEELPALGARKVVFVDKAFDTKTHRPLKVSVEDNTLFGTDVGFIGSFEEDRAKQMLFLAENGIVVRIWGNGWKSWVNKHSNLIVENRPIYNDEYIKGICATKINLCFLRKLNRDLQTDRTMEIPACGAFMLAERTGEHKRLFEEGREAAYFDSDQELLDKVSYYMAHEQERLAIAVAGRQRCLDSGYSHHERLEYMLKCLDTC